MQPSGFQQPLSGTIPGQYTQTTQMANPRIQAFRLIKAAPWLDKISVATSRISDWTSASPSSGYQQSNPVNQMSGLALAALQLSGPLRSISLRTICGSPSLRQKFSSLRGALTSEQTIHRAGCLQTLPRLRVLFQLLPQVIEFQVRWYYPGSTNSRKKFYVQTSLASSRWQAAATAAMFLWGEHRLINNFYVYEWYPGQTSPYVRWWGWTWPGWKKGWFSGDVPGWHILCFHCRDWSNYVYIYVWPGAGGVGTAGSGNGPIMPAMAQSSAALPSGAPTPPDPNAENLMLPDYSMDLSRAERQSRSDWI